MLHPILYLFQCYNGTLPELFVACKPEEEEYCSTESPDYGCTKDLDKACTEFHFCNAPHGEKETRLLMCVGARQRNLAVKSSKKSQGRAD